MIRLSLSWMIMLYLAFFLVMISLVWLVYVFGRNRDERRFLRYRVRCRICANEFEDRSNAMLPKCPVCGSLNERTEIERI
jgi:DNA-directed RNA polymerase subunit RPC12/RpoP